MSASVYVTETGGHEWRLVRTTRAGHDRYPYHIDVGGRMVVRYLPETVTVMRSIRVEDGVGHHECAACGSIVHRYYRYCANCGARFLRGDEVDRD